MIYSMTVVFDIEKYKEKEDLILENFNDLEIKQKNVLFTDIKFHKNDIINSQDEIYVHGKNEIEDVFDNDFDEDLLYNKLNDNSSLKDDSWLKENKIIDNKLFEISYDIYKEKYNKYKKRNFMILLIQIIH